MQASCIHIVTDCGSNSTQCLSPTHHLLIEFFEFMLTPYYRRQRCWMNYPLFLNVNHVRATYILVYLSESLTTKGLLLVNCVTFFSFNSLSKKKTFGSHRRSFLTRNTVVFDTLSHIYMMRVSTHMHIHVTYT